MADPRVEVLAGSLRNVKWTGAGSFKASCPITPHGKGRGDSSPSLSVAEGNNGGGPVATCHAGCDQRTVFEELRRICPEAFDGRRDNVVPVLRKATRRFTWDGKGTLRRWQAHDLSGKHVADHIRIDAPGKPKVVFWTHPPDDVMGMPDGVSYSSLRLFGHAELERHPADVPVFLVEGEPAADALNNTGVLAVATYGTSHAVADEALSPLLGDFSNFFSN